MAEGFNRQVWLQAALLERMDALSTRIFDTLSFKVDVKKKEAINVPTIVSGRRAQRTGDTIITALAKSLIAIPCDLVSYFGFAIPEDDLHTTDVALAQDHSRISVSEIIDDVEIVVGEEMTEGAATANKVTFTGLDTGATGYTFALLQEVNQLFDEAKVKDEVRYLRVNPRHYKSLTGIKNPDTNTLLWIETEKNDDLAKKKGIVGEIMGWKVQKSNNISKVNTSGAIDATPANNTQDVSLFYSSGACAVGLEESMTVLQATDVVTNGGEEVINIKQYYGTKVIRSGEIVALRDNT